MMPELRRRNEMVLHFKSSIATVWSLLIIAGFQLNSPSTVCFISMARSLGSGNWNYSEIQKFSKGGEYIVILWATRTRAIIRARIIAHEKKYRRNFLRYVSVLIFGITLFNWFLWYVFRLSRSIANIFESRIIANLKKKFDATCVLYSKTTLFFLFSFLSIPFYFM